MYRRLACAFEWNDQKNASNLKKHGIDFDTAVLVFLDPWFVMEEDRIQDGETRWRTIGEVDSEALLLVIHLLVDDEEGVERVALSRHAMPLCWRGDAMKVIYELKPGMKPTEDQRKMLRALKDRPIDFSDLPELPPDAFKNAVRGKFYRPVKQAVSLRLDADVIAWMKKDGDGYQTRANQMPRERMLEDLKQA